MPHDSGTIGKLGVGFAQLENSLASVQRFVPSKDGTKKISNRSVLDGIDQEQKTKEQQLKAATDFEALLLHQMVQTMWASVPQGGMLSGSNEEALYRDMLSEQLAQELAKNQSLGLRDDVLGEMQKRAKLETPK
jgi:Rod binding domain-containing protein